MFVCVLVMAAFETFVSNQWFGVRIKLGKSCDFRKRGFVTSYVITVSKQCEMSMVHRGGGGSLNL